MQKEASTIAKYIMKKYQLNINFVVFFTKNINFKPKLSNSILVIININSEWIFVQILADIHRETILLFTKILHLYNSTVLILVTPDL